MFSLLKARARKKQRLESLRKHKAQKEQERIQRAAQAQQNGSKVKFTDAAGNAEQTA